MVVGVAIPKQSARAFSHGKLLGLDAREGFESRSRGAAALRAVAIESVAKLVEYLKLDGLTETSASESTRHGESVVAPPNGEVEGPPGIARQAPRAHTVFRRPRRITTGRSRSPPTIVRCRPAHSHARRQLVSDASRTTISDAPNRNAHWTVRDEAGVSAQGDNPIAKQSARVCDVGLTIDIHGYSNVANGCACHHVRRVPCDQYLIRTWRQRHATSHTVGNKECGGPASHRRHGVSLRIVWHELSPEP